MDHQTDYRKQNLISINRKNYEYVNNILRHLKLSLVGGVSLLIILEWLPVTHT